MVLPRQAALNTHYSKTTHETFSGNEYGMPAFRLPAHPGCPWLVVR
jgi:hypothetical protein